MTLVMLAIWGLVQWVLDPLLWGIASYTMFMLLVRRDRWWQVGAWVSAGLYFVWDDVLPRTLLGAEGMSGVMEDVSHLVGTDIRDVDASDVVLSVALALGGFAIGRILVKRVASVLAAEGFGQQGSRPRSSFWPLKPDAPARESLEVVVISSFACASGFRATSWDGRNDDRGQAVHPHRPKSRVSQTSDRSHG